MSGDDRRPRDRGGEGDPARWRHAPAPAAGTTSSAEAEIGAVVRALPPAVAPDDVRLAQIRQRIRRQTSSESTGPRRRRLAIGPAWLRPAVLAFLFVLLGGLTTALAARLYAWRADRRAAALPAAAAPHGAGDRGKRRRWRLAVKDAAAVDLSVGPEGAEIAVVGGQAEVTGAEIPGSLLLGPGSSWREGVAAPAPAVAAPPPVVPAAPPPHPSPNPPATLALRPSAPRAAAIARLALAPPPPRRSPSPSPVAAAASDRGALGPSLEPPPFSYVGVPSASPPSLSPSWSSASPPPNARPLAPPPPPSEASVMASALRTLRVDHDPQRALEKLDDHRRLFPGGVLRREAALARVEALLGLGRNDAALDVLDSLSLGGAGADRKATLARAELRAAGGRCAQALGDLDHLVEAAGPDDDIAARALYDRARCRLGARELDSARADLREYLRRFPAGDRRSEARALLGRLDHDRDGERDDD